MKGQGPTSHTKYKRYRHHSPTSSQNSYRFYVLRVWKNYQHSSFSSGPRISCSYNPKLSGSSILAESRTVRLFDHSLTFPSSSILHQRPILHISLANIRQASILQTWPIQHWPPFPSPTSITTPTIPSPTSVHSLLSYPKVSASSTQPSSGPRGKSRFFSSLPVKCSAKLSTSPSNAF